MKLPLLVSAALALVSAAPGVLSEEHASAVVKPSTSLNGALEAVSLQTADIYGDEEKFDAVNDNEELDENVNDSKKSRRNKNRNSRRRSSRSSSPSSLSSRGSRGSSRRRSRRRSSRNRNRNRRRARGMCGRNMRSRDERTCREIRREFCRNKTDRKSNRQLCRNLGFPTVAEGEGANANAIETYASDSEVFSEDTINDAEMIVDEIMDEIGEEDEDTSYDDYSEDSNDEDSEDFDFDEEDTTDAELVDRGRNDRSFRRSVRRSIRRNVRSYCRGRSCGDRSSRRRRASIRRRGRSFRRNARSFCRGRSCGNRSARRRRASIRRRERSIRRNNRRRCGRRFCDKLTDEEIAQYLGDMDETNPISEDKDKPTVSTE